MLICTTHLTRKKAALAVILAGAALIGLIALLGRGPAPAEADPSLLPANQDRIDYIRALGWEVAEEPVEILQFLLPASLSGDYIAYNALQKAQGMDLEPCCGKQVTRYTYSILNYPGRPEGVQLNLYLCEDAVVAGDVLCAGSNGFQGPLAFPAETSAA